MPNRLRIVSVAVALGLGLASSSLAETRRYVIDPQHLTMGFLVEHLGFAKVFGRFTEVEGSFDFDEDAARIENVRVTVKTASVDTSVAPRDRHLRSADFLDVENHPEMVFTSPGTTLVERKGSLTGVLTIRGSPRTLTLDVTWNKSGVSPLPGEPYVAGMSARGSVRRSEFGITYGVADGLVGDEVELLLELEAHRQ